MSTSRDIDWMTTYVLSHTDGETLVKNPPTPYHQITPSQNNNDNALAATMFSSMAQNGLGTMSLGLPLATTNTSQVNNNNHNNNHSFVPNHNNSFFPTPPQPPQYHPSQPKLQFNHDVTNEDVIIEYLFNNTNLLTSEKCYIQLVSYWYRGTFYTPPHSTSPTSSIHNSSNNQHQSTTAIIPQSPVLGSLLQSLPPSALINILSYLNLDELLSLLPTCKIFALSVTLLLLSPKYRHSITGKQHMLFQQAPLPKWVPNKIHQNNYFSLQNSISTHLTELQTHFLTQTTLNSTFINNIDNDDLTLDDLLNNNGGSANIGHFGSLNTTTSPTPSPNPHSFGSFAQFGYTGGTTTTQNSQSNEHVQLKSHYLEQLLLDTDTLYRTTIHIFTDYKENTVIMPYYYHTYPVFVPKKMDTLFFLDENDDNIHNHREKADPFSTTNGITKVIDNLDESEKKYYLYQFLNNFDDSNLAYEFPRINTATSPNPLISLNTTPSSILQHQESCERVRNHNLVFNKTTQNSSNNPPNSHQSLLPPPITSRMESFGSKFGQDDDQFDDFFEKDTVSTDFDSFFNNNDSSTNNNSSPNRPILNDNVTTVMLTESTIAPLFDVNNQNDTNLVKNVESNRYSNSILLYDQYYDQDYQDHVQNNQKFIFKYLSFNQITPNTPQIQPNQPHTNTNNSNNGSRPPSQPATPVLKPNSVNNHTTLPSSHLLQSNPVAKMVNNILNTTSANRQYGAITGPNSPNQVQINDNSTTTENDCSNYDNTNTPSSTFTHDILHEYPHLGQSWGRWSTKRGLIWSLFFLPTFFERWYDVTTLGIASTRSKQLELAGFSLGIDHIDTNNDSKNKNDLNNNSTTKVINSLPKSSHTTTTTTTSQNPLWNLHDEKLVNYNNYIATIYYCLQQPNLHHFLNYRLGDVTTSDNTYKLATQNQRAIFARFFSLLPHNSSYRHWIITNNYSKYSQILIPSQVGHTLLFEGVFANLPWDPTQPLFFNIFHPHLHEKVLPFEPSLNSSSKNNTTSLMNRNEQHDFERKAISFRTLAHNSPHYHPKLDLTIDISHSIMKDCDRTLINKSCRCYYKDKSGHYFGTMKQWFVYYYRLSLLHFPMEKTFLYDENADLRTQHQAYEYTSANNSNNTGGNSGTGGSGSMNYPGNNSNNNNNRNNSLNNNNSNNTMSGMRQGIKQTDRLAIESTLASGTNNTNSGKSGLNSGQNGNFHGVNDTKNSQLATLMAKNDDLRGCSHCNDMSNITLCLLLHSLAHIYPDIGYCQGLNFITAQVLLQCDIATTFAILVYILRYEAKGNKNNNNDIGSMLLSHQYTTEQNIPIYKNDNPVSRAVVTSAVKNNTNNITTNYNSNGISVNKLARKLNNYNNFSSINVPKITTIPLPSYIPIEYKQQLIFKYNSYYGADDQQPIPICFDTQDLNKAEDSNPTVVTTTKTVALPHYTYGIIQDYINVVTINDNNDNNYNNNDRSGNNKNKKTSYYLHCYHQPNKLQHRLFFTSNLLGWHLCKYTFLTLLRLFLPTLFINLKKTQFPLALLTDWFMTLFSSPSMHIAPSFMMCQPQLTVTPITLNSTSNNSNNGDMTPSRTSTRPLVSRTQQITNATNNSALTPTSPSQLDENKNNQKDKKNDNNNNNNMYELHCPVAILWDNIIFHGEIVLYKFVLQLLLLGTKHFQLDYCQFDELHQFKSFHVTHQYMCSNAAIRKKVLNKIISSPTSLTEPTSQKSNVMMVNNIMKHGINHYDDNNPNNNNQKYNTATKQMQNALNVITNNKNNNNNNNLISNNKNYIQSLRNHSNALANIITDDFFHTLQLMAITCMDKTGSKMHMPLFDQ